MTTETTNTTPQWKITALTEALGDLELTVTDTLTIGRSTDNDVVLGSKQVSRQHAQLEIKDGELFVIDLGSSNGTLVNDTKIDANVAQPLNNDDVISFAVFAFKVAQQQPAEQQQINEVVAAMHEEQLEDVLEAELEEPIAVGNPEQDNKDAETTIASAVNPVTEEQKKLAEEADPDVLRAKQVATSQLSGTSNTQLAEQSDGKPAVADSVNTISEQKQHSVAHVDPKQTSSYKQTTKKNSKAMTFWIALILLGIAVALWLFNSGTMA